MFEKLFGNKKEESLAERLFRNKMTFIDVTDKKEEVVLGLRKDLNNDLLEVKVFEGNGTWIVYSSDGLTKHVSISNAERKVKEDEIEFACLTILKEKEVNKSVRNRVVHLSPYVPEEKESLNENFIDVTDKREEMVLSIRSDYKNALKKDLLEVKVFEGNATRMIYISDGVEKHVNISNYKRKVNDDEIEFARLVILKEKEVQQSVDKNGGIHLSAFITEGKE